MDVDNVIEVRQISKKFTRNLRRSLLYGSIDLFKGFFGIKPNTQKLRNSEFWALKNIDFNLRAGETLGLVGKNGSGKSTLLRLINGIFPPDEGEVHISGRIGALIAVGAGFNPHMTGKENIYLNGTILGMTKKEIDSKYTDIVSFADIGEFLDAPVSVYSSGMKVRLGFAIAIHADIKILLADEVLAVGDVNFQKKCFEKIFELKHRGISTILVSHAIPQLERLCERSVLIHKGEQIYFGPTREAVKKYIDIMEDEKLSNAKLLTNKSYTVGVGNFTVEKVSIVNNNGEDVDEIKTGESFSIKLNYKFKQKIGEKYQIRFSIKTFEGREVQKFHVQEKTFQDNLKYDNETYYSLPVEGEVVLSLKQNFLFPQTYIIDVAAVSIDETVHEGGMGAAKTFRVTEDEKNYYEYGNESVTNFDYSISIT